MTRIGIEIIDLDGPSVVKVLLKPQPAAKLNHLRISW
jgi:hypothetical protein